MPIYWDSKETKIRRCDWCKKMYDKEVTRAKNTAFCSPRCELEFNRELDRMKRIAGD